MEDHFDNLYRMHPRTKLVTVYFNGSSTVNEEPKNSGRWACANNMYIDLDEVVDIFSRSCPVQRIDIISDCCGASGAYYRLKESIQGKILDEKIKIIRIMVPCNYDEQSSSMTHSFFA